MNKLKIFLAGFITVLLLGIFALYASPVVISDGYCYYHIARSIVDNGSFVSVNKPDYYDYRGHVIAYSDGVYKDVCSPGTAFALVPGLLISKQIRDHSQNQYNNYFISYSGHTLEDGIAILATSVLFAVIALLYFYKTVRGFFQDKKVALLICIALFTSGYIINYIFQKPFFTHTYEFFAGVLFLYNIISYQKHKSLKNLLAAGLVVSFGFTVRPFFFLPSALWWGYLVFKKEWKAALIFALANLPFVLLWLAYNYVSYGKLITSGYNEIRGENFDFGSFNLIPLLLSPWKGWLLWSPIVITGFWGFALKLKRKVFTYLDFICLATIILVIISYSFWPAWWGGGSYGARFMIINIPFLVPGVVYIFQQYYIAKYPILKVFTLLCIIYSVAFSLLYLITPNDSPRKMLAYQSTNLAGFSKDPVEYYGEARHAADMDLGFADLLFGQAHSVIKVDDRVVGAISFLSLDNYRSQLFKPQSFTAYIKNQQTAEVTRINFDLTKNSGTIKIVNGALVAPSEGMVKIAPQTELPSSFDSQEYTRFSLDNNRYSIFFPNIALKFAGPNKTDSASAKILE